ncbi:DMT family transporter [Serratia fonticola]|uniref:DMT family transporter n=1 Tax=Serratia fonticola TaxID=47917 RepID=UPI00301C7EB3
MKKRHLRNVFTFLLFIMVSATWGTTWFAMKIAVETIPPFFATGLRFLLASPALLLIAKYYGKPLLFPKGQRVFQLIICIFYFALPFTFMIYGEETVSSGMASIIFSFMPIAVVILSHCLLNHGITKVQVAGVFISIVALGVIINHESGTVTIQGWKGVAALAAAVILHAIIYVRCKKLCAEISVLTYNTLPCLGAGILLVVFGVIFEKVSASAISTESLLSVAYLGVVSGVFGIIAYFQLQQRVKPFHASLVFFIFPIIAILLESYITGQTISMLSLWMLPLLLTGVFLVLMPTSWFPWQAQNDTAKNLADANE